jgi:large conductance mechanosensitive channel
MIKEFRDFILRGNLVELAVAVVIGTAFAAVVAALVADLVTPLIAAVGGEQDFSGLTLTINDSEFRYGHFLALIAFLIAAVVVFFFVIKPVNALMARRQTETPSTSRRGRARSAAATSPCSPIAARSARPSSGWRRRLASLAVNGDL